MVEGCNVVYTVFMSLGNHSMLSRVLASHTDTCWQRCHVTRSFLNASWANVLNAKILICQTTDCDNCKALPDSHPNVECQCCGRVQKLRRDLVYVLGCMNIEEITYKAWVSVDHTALKTCYWGPTQTKTGLLIMWKMDLM